MDYKLFILKIILGFFLFVIFLSVPVSASSIGLIKNSTWQQNISKVRFGSLAFGDIDNDGDLDLALTGCDSGGGGGNDCNAGTIAKIYINNGTTLNENTTWQTNLTGIGHSSLAFGDIDNDGDLDLAMIGCTSATSIGGCVGEVVAKIYINNGTTLNENTTWQTNLTKMWRGSLAFGDIDNDGRLDIAQVGMSNGGVVAKIYINNGTTLNENTTWQTNLTGIYDGNIAFGDIDNDDDLDLAVLGRDGSNNNHADIFINNGSSLIENTTWQTQLTKTTLGSLSWGDYDNDGDLDLVEMGIGDYLRIYKNNGTTLVKNQTDAGEGGNLIGVYEGSLSWGDYDNDGDLDLVATGYEVGRNRIYNNSENIFGIDNTAGADLRVDDIHQNSLAWGDLDNDGDLDLAVIGINIPDGLIARIYINNITTPNTAPSPPTSFSSSYANGRLALSWNSGSDTQTPSSGLYYNLRVGTCSGCNDIVSGVYGGSSNPTAGYFGNMMQRKSISLAVPSRTYYWSVQAIDTGLAKSSWSAEQTVTTTTTTTTATTTSTTTSTTTITTTTAGAGGGAGALQANVTVNATKGESTITMNVTRGESSITISREANTGVTGISITVSNPATDVRITVTKLEGKPAAVAHELAGKVYHYIEINKTNIQDKDIDRINITFTVNKSWVSDNHINDSTIALNRYTASWESLPTIKLTEDADSIYYEAESPGLSIFAITGEEMKPPAMPTGWIVGIVAAMVGLIAFLVWKYGRIKENRTHLAYGHAVPLGRSPSASFDIFPTNPNNYL